MTNDPDFNGDGMSPAELPPIESMIEEFYRGLPWPKRTAPTADIGDEELEVLRRLVVEECGELLSALDRRDLHEVADALADLTYVVYSAARHFGFDLHRAVWVVHQANMTKAIEEGRFALDANRKVARGPSYRSPDLSEVLGDA